MEKVLCVSTTHILPNTARWIEDVAIEESFFVRNEGYMLPVHLDTGYPSDLRKVFMYAKEAGADWLLLDSDGHQYDELPIYEWE